MAEEENPPDFLDREICPVCPWGREFQEPVIFRLLRYCSLMDVGCVPERHELLNEEWFLIGPLQAERARLAEEKRREEGNHNPPSSSTGEGRVRVGRGKG